MTDPRFDFRISDIAGIGEPGDNLRLSVALVAFWAAQRRSKSPSHDKMLDELDGDRLVLVTLTIMLAKIDPVFFDLSNRMAANTLMKHRGNVGSLVAIQAAIGLTYPRPSVGKSTIARDVAILVGVANACRMGMKPTERKSKKPNAPASESGSRLSFELAAYHHQFPGMPTIQQIGQIWDNREKILQRAGFTKTDASRFSEYYSRTNWIA